MIKSITAGSRFIIGVAVLATFLGSVVLLVAATLSVIGLVRAEIANFSLDRYTPHHVDRLGVQFIQLTDIVLLGTVMYIVALGLYQLFIEQHLPVPRWLRVRDLIELKRDLLGVTVVLLGVTFLGEVVDWNSGDTSILVLGAAVALVVASLGFILWLTPAPHPDEKSKAVGPGGSSPGPSRQDRTDLPTTPR